MTSGDDAVAAAAERAKTTAARNIPGFADLPAPPDTANLREGANLNDSLLALLPLVGVWRGEGEGRGSDGDYRFGQQIVVSHDGGDYLVALAGESQWVRNARAAGGHAVIRRRRARRVRLDELAPDDRGEIIAAYLDAGRRRGGAKTGDQQARYYFGLDPHPSQDDIDAIAGYYPVFRITYET